MASRLLSSSLPRSLLPSSFSPSSSSSSFSRFIHAPASAPSTNRIPPPRLPITSTADLLAASRRKLSQYEQKLGDWDSLFTKTSVELREAGMTSKERRYLLWLLERYRQGQDIDAVAVAAKPKKKYRGWGPKVQLGKRIR